MSKSYWTTRPSSELRRRVERPTGGQVLRQLGVALLVVAFWGVIFAAYLDMTLEEETAAVVVPPAPTAVAAAPTSTPTPAPTGTRAAVPTSIPTPALQRATATPSPVPSVRPTNLGTTAEPSPTADSAPTETPPPTETSAPATETATQVPTSTAELPASATPTVPSAEADQVSFASDVLPILQNRCVKCHGGERTEEGLVLTTYADLMVGSWNGPVVVPGSAEDSYLVEQVVSGEMPKRAPRLLPGEIRFIIDWINAGAPDN